MIEFLKTAAPLVSIVTCMVWWWIAFDVRKRLNVLEHQARLEALRLDSAHRRIDSCWRLIDNVAGHTSYLLGRVADADEASLSSSPAKGEP